MSLPPGQYTICNKQYGLYVGRSQKEDKSLNPKPIVALPGGDRPAWMAKQNNSNANILMVGDAPTATINNGVCAVLQSQPSATQWKITLAPQPDGNTHTYIITRADNPSLGWVMPSGEPGTQVAVRPLLAVPIYPPIYPPNQLWIITR
ncbi:hypothetical protein FRB94_007216 [Tulasnella sp. JGI-2019a]|nr:hypothetical protein FRB93_007273 [Tulasnella sp. JGI-2019a]KAG8998089.1 hypothetical protein FRB94_007216 [Tulasnella sp. JGI-2019a]KAG9029027.1 hypothetical protein FRB95_005803 [Tulasnella sp. JGI-2019a]